MLDIRNNRVMVEVACNDPDNGNFAGRAEQIHIGNQFVELESRHDPAPRFVELGDRVRIAGKCWPVHGVKGWFGNWCWNGYWMAVGDAADFLCWLHSRRLYDLTCGEERIFNMWKLEKPFDSDDREFFDRLLGKPSMHAF